ncbi:hypothetical protein R3P38DRAFT_3165818 [Favolaschia claudopus]|uniref:Uncharacterized protein n=1 Tax=Favolaschia claudopus TaxID=2862362 RepID=A0AAW0EHH4_9AGAR
MTSPPPSGADRLRIAIALTALKFKPAEQSCACTPYHRVWSQESSLIKQAYVLYLRNKFPPSAPSFQDDGLWKTRALALEKEVADLKAKYEEEQIKNLAAPASAPSDAAPNNSQPVKRKAKKKAPEKPVEAPRKMNLETLLEDLHGRKELASLPTSTSLFANLSAFQQLISALSSSEVPVTAAQRSLLSSTAVRTFTSISNVLHPILRSTEITVTTHLQTLQTLATLLQHLISSSLAVLLRKPKRAANQNSVSSLMNRFLDALVTSIFNPIIESFSPLSCRFLAFLFPAKSSSTLPVDLRPDVLHILQSALSPLPSATTAFEANLRATIALTALRELENLFSPQQTKGGNSRTRESRIGVLARKDALWYLCSVLHVVFTPSSAEHSTLSSNSLTNSAVSERNIADSLSRIIGRCRKSSNATSVDEASCPNEDHDRERMFSAGDLDEINPDVVDEVGFQMILGVAEKYWRWIGDVRDLATDLQPNEMEDIPPAPIQQ